MRLKRTKKQVQLRKRYGRTKIRTGEKLCWISMENKNGWSLGLAIGKKTLWLRNTRFASIAEVNRALDANPLFVHLRDSKEVEV